MPALNTPALAERLRESFSTPRASYAEAAAALAACFEDYITPLPSAAPGGPLIPADGNTAGLLELALSSFEGAGAVAGALAASFQLAVGGAANPAGSAVTPAGASAAGAILAGALEEVFAMEVAGDAPGPALARARAEAVAQAYRAAAQAVRVVSYSPGGPPLPLIVN